MKQNLKPGIPLAIALLMCCVGCLSLVMMVGCKATGYYKLESRVLGQPVEVEIDAGGDKTKGFVVTFDDPFVTPIIKWLTGKGDQTEADGSTQVEEIGVTTTNVTTATPPTN